MTDRQWDRFTGICGSQRCQRPIFSGLYCNRQCQSEARTDRLTVKKQQQRLQAIRAGWR